MPNSVEVPLWLVTAIVGLLSLGVTRALRIGAQLVSDVQGLRQLLIGYDGKNGIRGNLQLLDATVENLDHDIQDIRLKMTEDRGRLERVEEEVERFRGFAA